MTGLRMYPWNLMQFILPEGTRHAVSVFIACLSGTRFFSGRFFMFDFVSTKFSEVSAAVWISVGTVCAVAAVLLAIARTRKRWTAKTLCFAALSVSLSFVLSCIRLYRMPSGGSVTPASMLPVMLFSASCGIGPGLLAGLVLGVLQYLQGGWFLNVWQFTLDYLLAFAALGLCGLYRIFKKQNMIRFILCILLAAACRAISATLAGYMFWDTALWPSLVYNGTYLIPDSAICILLAIPVAKPVMKVIRG